MVQWLGLHAFTAEGVGLIPRQGANILLAGREKKKKMQVLKSHTNGHSSSERKEIEAKHQRHLLQDYVFSCLGIWFVREISLVFCFVPLSMSQMF